MTHPIDGFESAAASVLGDPNAPADTSTNGSGAPLSPEEIEKLRRQKKRIPGAQRGRPAGGSPGASSASSGNTRAHTAPIETPKPLPPPPPLDPARVEAMFRDVVNPLLSKLGADPFTTEEARAGAKVIAPLWDDYAAKAAAQGQSKINPLWAAFWMWAVPVAGPRALQASLVVWARYKQRQAAKKGAGFDAETTRQENDARAVAAAPAVPPDTFRDPDAPAPVGNIGRGLVPLRTPGLA